MPTLCGPDKLQKKSIARSVPKAEGAGCPFAYFSDKGKVRLADASRVEQLFIVPSMAIVAPAHPCARDIPYILYIPSASCSCTPRIHYIPVHKKNPAR